MSTLRLFSMGFIPGFVLIAGLGFWFIAEQGEIVLERYRIEAAHHVEEQAKQIQVFYAREASVLKALAHDKSILRALAGDAGAKREVVTDFIDIMQVSDIYDQIRVLDLSGREVVRVNRLRDALVVVPPQQLQNKALREYVQQGLNLPRGAIYASPLDLNLEHGQVKRPEKAMVRLVTPIFDGAAVKQGLLVINVLGLRVLHNDLSETPLRGESLLLNSGCSYWFDLNHRHGTEALLGLDHVGQVYGLSSNWLDTLSGSRGRVVTPDGQFIYEFFKPVLPEAVSAGSSPLQWRVVSFVPAAVLEEAVAAAASRTPYYCALATLFFGILFWLWSGQHMLMLTAVRQREQLSDANRHLAQSLIQVREAERNAMARVLHDEVGQALAAVQLRLGRLAMDCEGDGCAAAARVRGEEVYISKVVEALRGQLRLLRPPELDAIGLRGSLLYLLDEMDRQHAMDIDADIDVQVDGLDDDLRLGIYRLVQEALTNILRHASATQVHLMLKLQGGWVDGLIEDNGCGFDVSKEAAGFGLIGMRERMELLGGSLRVDSAPGRGTRKYIRLPASFDKTKG